MKIFSGAAARERTPWSPEMDAGLEHAIAHSINEYFKARGLELGTRLVPFLKVAFALPGITPASKEVRGFEDMCAIGQAAMSGAVRLDELGRAAIALATDGTFPNELRHFQALRFPDRTELIPAPKRTHFCRPDTARVIRRGMLRAALEGTGQVAWLSTLVRGNRCMVVGLKTGSHSSGTNVTVVLVDPRWRPVPRTVDEAEQGFRPRYVIVAWLQGRGARKGELMYYAGTSVAPMALRMAATLR